MSWTRGVVLAAMVSTAATAQGCCCDNGTPRLTAVEVTTETGLPVAMPFDGTTVDFPVDAFFTAYRIGSPGVGKLRTTPLLQLFDQDAVRIPLERFTAFNDGGCAIAEIYEPADAALVVGQTYTLVHPASASPGALADSGDTEGELAAAIVEFNGEEALVGTIRAVEAVGIAGAGGGGASAGGASAGGASAGGASAGGASAGGASAGGGGGA